MSIELNAIDRPARGPRSVQAIPARSFLNSAAPASMAGSAASTAIQL